MRRPWWHPLILTVSVGMFSMTLHLLVNAALAVGFQMAASTFPEGSFGRTVNEDVLHQDYVSNWSILAANVIWIAVFTSALLLALRYLRMHLVSDLMAGGSFDGKDDVEDLSDEDYKELDHWVNKSVVTIGVIGRPWS